MVTFFSNFVVVFISVILCVFREKTIPGYLIPLFSFICILYCLIPSNKLQQFRFLQNIKKQIVLAAGFLTVFPYIGIPYLTHINFIHLIAFIIAAVLAVLFWLINKKVSMGKTFLILICFYGIVLGQILSTNIVYDKSQPEDYTCEIIEIQSSPFLFFESGRAINARAMIYSEELKRFSQDGTASVLLSSRQYHTVQAGEQAMISVSSGVFGIYYVSSCAFN